MPLNGPPEYVIGSVVSFLPEASVTVAEYVTSDATDKKRLDSQRALLGDAGKSHT